MIGLRKVVRLKIYDLPQSEVVVKKNGVEPKTFGYSYEAKYYIGKEEFFRTKTHSEKKSSIIPRKFNDTRLVEIIRSSVENEEELEKALNMDGKGFMYFSEQGDRIVYYGDKKEELKDKLLAKRK